MRGERLFHQEEFDVNYAWDHMPGVARYVKWKFQIPSMKTLARYWSDACDEEAKHYIY